MKHFKKLLSIDSRALGALGALLWIVAFARQPSFPTPDKLVIFMLFVAMIVGQAREVIKRFFPFVLLLLTYESFRGIADQLNTHVDYGLAPSVDKFIFGNLPTHYLQNWLWHGNVVWYDYVLYIPYFLHFVIPLGLGVLIWRTRESEYWRVMNTFLVVAFMAFLTYLIFPAAPPWLASDRHHIIPIVHIADQIWKHLGIHDFPSLYQHISPNAVAAIPSLHAAWATLIPIFIYKLYGRRWAILSCAYPALIFFGTVYVGEHYAFDIMLGISYALIAYWLTPRLMRLGARHIVPRASKVWGAVDSKISSWLKAL